MNSNQADTGPIQPVVVDASGWEERKCLPLTVAQLWATYMPRAKGAFARLLGRLFPNQIQCSITTRHGARLAVTPAGLDEIVYMLERGGSHDEHAFNAARACLRPGGVFYDIGANVGYFSIEMAHVFADAITVVAVEPQPALSRATALSASLNRFNNIKVFEVMLGEQEGWAELFIGSHATQASAIALEKNSRVLQCRITTIDHMLQSHLIPPPTTIKLDIEGSELAALRGAERTLRKHLPAIIYECEVVNTSRFGYSGKEIIEFLKGVGYDEFKSITEDGTLVPLAAPGAHPAGVTGDFFAGNSVSPALAGPKIALN